MFRVLAACGLAVAIVVQPLPASAAPAGPQPAAAGALATKSAVVPRAVPAVTAPRTGTTTARLNLRTGAGTTYRIVKVLALGAKVSILATHSSGWHRVTASGSTGWVSARYVRIGAATPTPAATTAGTTTTLVNMRTGAGTAYRIVKTLPAGTALRIHSRHSNGWYRVTAAGATGWVSGAYVTSSGVSPYNSRTKGPNKTERVVLTYDDCPRTLASYTQTVRWARDNGIALVLAPTGDCLAKFRTSHGVDLAVYGRQHGQWMINHSVSHPDLRRLTCTQVRAQLQGTGVRSNWGRPPYGAVNAAVECGYRAAGMHIWNWSKDTWDWQSKSKAVTISRAVTRAAAGDTVLMHFQWQGFSPDSIRQIKTGLAAKGLGLCRAYRGTDGVGAVVQTPVALPVSLPC